jgi:hypothetical protein
MAATILNSPGAAEVSVYVVRAFVRLRDGYLKPLSIFAVAIYAILAYSQLRFKNRGYRYGITT